MGYRTKDKIMLAISLVADAILCEKYADACLLEALILDWLRRCYGEGFCMAALVTVELAVHSAMYYPVTVRPEP